jgi:hypothetical protein
LRERIGLMPDRARTGCSWPPVRRMDLLPCYCGMRMPHEIVDIVVR